MRGAGDLEKAVKSGSRRDALIALRDLIAHELEVERCSKCQATQLRTGDFASLALRLTKVLEEIESIPEFDGEVSDLDRIRARRNGTPVPEDISRTTGTSPQAVRRRQGGRRPSGTRGPSSRPVAGMGDGSGPSSA